MQKETIGSFQGAIVFHGAYLIECSPEDSLQIRHSTAPVAINPILNYQEHQARWGTNSFRGEYIAWETVTPNSTQFVEKEKSVEDEPIHVDEAPKEIIFKKNSHVLKLVKLTRELFEQRVRPNVAGGSTLKFSTDEEVQNFFLETDFEG